MVICFMIICSETSLLLGGPWKLVSTLGDIT